MFLNVCEVVWLVFGEMDDSEVDCLVIWYDIAF